jgi:purine-binding chemotaxis protein CheW
MVKDIRMCCDLIYINKIILLPKLDKIPNCPKEVAGLMNIADNSIPVVDLTIKLNLQRTHSYTLDTPILLCHYKKKYLGLIIDQIIGLDTIDKKNIQSETGLQESISYFSGSIALQNKLTLVVNIEKIFAAEEEVAL